MTHHHTFASAPAHGGQGCCIRYLAEHDRSGFGETLYWVPAEGTAFRSLADLRKKYAGRCLKRIKATRHNRLFA